MDKEPLNQSSHNEFRPSVPILREYIHSFWILRSEIKEEYCPYLLPPDPFFDCILSFKSDTNAIKSNGNSDSISGSFICGIRTKPISVKPNGDIEYLAIRFYPHGLRPFLNFHCKELTNLVVELESVKGMLAETLKPIWDYRVSDIERIKIIEESLLLLLIKRNYHFSKEIYNGIRIIRKTEGQISVSELCDRLGTSSRSLHREFERFVGVSPKTFARIVRFGKMLNSMRNYNEDSLAGLAFDCGYFDQAHMIHECTEFSGLTPLELLYLIRDKI